MSATRPQSLQEWADHISSLSRSQLTSKAVACNTMSFVQDLKREGYLMDAIEVIFALLARALYNNKLMLPTGGVFDYEELLSKKIMYRGDPAKAVNGPDDVDKELDALD